MALTGIKYKAYPSDAQAEVLRRWIGCARVIYNAKCDEDRYLRTFARKYLPVGTYPPIDKEFARYKGEDTAWLSECPSQILRNSATLWHRAYRRFLKGLGGRPRRKRREDGQSIWLTRELFRIERVDGRWGLHLGPPAGRSRFALGLLRVKWHRAPRALPNSIWLRHVHGRWTVSFSYDDGRGEHLAPSLAEHREYLGTCSREDLERWTVGIDRGVARPVQAGDAHFAPTRAALAKERRREKYLRRCERHKARQYKGSSGYRRTCARIARLHGKTAAVREDLLQKASRTIVDTQRVFVIEDLKIKQITRRPKARRNEQTRRWEHNGARAKAGLNRALLGAGLYRFELLLRQKAERLSKPVFKVNAGYTSMECAACGHTHPGNRPSQAVFRCLACGNADNADRNASLVIKKRAINLLLHSGTELSERRVLVPAGMAAKLRKTRGATAPRAVAWPSRKIPAARVPRAQSMLGEARSFRAE